MILRALAVVLAFGFVASTVPAVAQTPDKGDGARARGSRAKPAQPSGARRGDAPTAESDDKPAAGARPANARSGRGRPAGAPAGLQATPVAVFGDWNVFAAGQGRARICYAITQPKVRQPASLKRDAAYLFVTVRKAENQPNEVALILGFAARTGAQAAAPRGAADPTLIVGTTNYGLVVKDANAWLQNTADEGRAVNEMGRAGRLVVKAVSLRGNPSTDEYSLTGFGDAMKRTREECK